MAGGRVEGGEKFILCQDICFSKRIEKSGFARIGIANNRDNGDGLLRTLLPMEHALLTHSFDLLAEFCDTTADTATINFQFCFTRAAHADRSTYTSRTAGTTSLLRELSTASCQMGEEIL